MREFLFLIFGALIGSLLTRQYDQHKGKDDDRHKLLLAANEVGDFETTMLCWQSAPHWQGPLTTISDRHIREFLETRLSVFLPSEVRADFKQICDWIAECNQIVKKLNGLPLPEQTMQELSEHAVSLEKYFHDNLVRIWNAVLYTRSARYILLGIRPGELEILQPRTAKELVELQMKLKAI